LLREQGNKRFNLDFLPVIFVAAFLTAGQLHSGGWEVSASPVSLKENIRSWIEVQYPDRSPCVYGFAGSPTLAELIPGSGREEDKRLENGTRVRILSREPLDFREEKMPGSHLLLFGQKIDVNRAGRRDLEAIPGIGPSLSERILQYREENGDFRELSGLLDVRGIGPKSLSKIEQYLTINLND